MFENFEEFNIAATSDVKIHGIKSSGNRPPILLLHGFPQTHHIWHKVAPQLTSTHTVIALDLRGYGKSSKPPSTASDSHKAYAKSTMAADCVAVMKSLGYEKFDILSHDRGARVAHKLCVDYPDKVGRVMFLDIAPTLAMFGQTNQYFATAYWHWFFLIQPAPFPEKAITGNPAVFHKEFFGVGGIKPEDGVFHTEALQAYTNQLHDESGVHGMCEDYRAAATIDLEEAKKDLDEGRKIQCPVRVLWGKKGVVEKCFDAIKEWQLVSDGDVSGEAVNAGHYIAEEAPEDLMAHVTDFFQ